MRIRDTQKHTDPDPQHCFQQQQLKNKARISRNHPRYTFLPKNCNNPGATKYLRFVAPFLCGFKIHQNMPFCLIATSLISSKAASLASAASVSDVTSASRDVTWASSDVTSASSDVTCASSDVTWASSDVTFASSSPARVSSPPSRVARRVDSPRK
jgi:hypothetical protein